MTRVSPVELADDDSALDQQPGESSMAHGARMHKIHAARMREDMERWAAEPKRRGNPLRQLPEEARSKLFVRLRDCPYPDAVIQMLAEQGVPGVTEAELNQFFEEEARQHWERRLRRAATEAMTRMTNLFLKARGDERADQLMELRREDARRKWRDQTEAALESFAAELEAHPGARAAFEALRVELLRDKEAV